MTQLDLFEEPIYSALYASLEKFPKLRLRLASSDLDAYLTIYRRPKESRVKPAADGVRREFIDLLYRWDGLIVQHMSRNHTSKWTKAYMSNFLNQAVRLLREILDFIESRWSRKPRSINSYLANKDKMGRSEFVLASEIIVAYGNNSYVSRRIPNGYNMPA